MQDLPLAGFDKEARQFVLEQYERAGIHFHGCSSPSKISKGANGKLTITVEPYKRGVALGATWVRRVRVDESHRVATRHARRGPRSNQPPIVVALVAEDSFLG